MKIAIRNGRVIDPANQLDTQADIAVSDGKILHVGTLPTDFTPDKTIDAKDLWVLPGLVDIYCRPHMQHPHGTTLLQEAKAALTRGITSLCIPPDGDLIIDSTANVQRLIHATDEALPHRCPIGALTHGLHGETIADLTALKEAGCIAFSNVQKPIADLQIVRHCYDYAASFNLPIIISPQDPWLSKGGVAHEGAVATRLGLPGIPETAETIAIAQHLLLIEQTGIRAHFTCLSSAQAVNQILHAKKQGLNVSADTAMHMLHLTEMDIGLYDANCHLMPPLRSLRDRDALLKGVQDNTLAALCSDHRPLDSIAKLAPFGDTTPGMSTIDTFLSLGLHLTHQKKLEVSTLVKAITCGPAFIFNLPAGTLSVGAKADICILSPKEYWKVEDETMRSKGKNSAFKSWELPGVVTHTLLNGKIVYGP